MTIDADVKAIAKDFGIDAGLIQAVVNAEGGGQAIVRAVQCSIPSIQTRAEALDVVCRSAVHAMSDYTKAHDAEGFVKFWGARWAPVGVANDPHGLNQFWGPNVSRFWEQA